MVKTCFVATASVLQAMAISQSASGGAAQHRGPLVPSDYRYRVAFISTFDAPAGHTRLLIFPFHGTALTIPIRSIAAPMSYSLDGKGLYGQCTPYHETDAHTTQVAICKLDLDTGVTSLVPGSMGMYIGDLSISKREDLLLVSGVHRRDSDIRGLFEIRLPTGQVRQLLLQTDRRQPFRHLSLSPDGKRAVAVDGGRLELIDVSRATSKPMNEELFIAAWSPDGQWLAAVEKGEQGRTILMDSETLTVKRIMTHTELNWSPDSRYLLGSRPCDAYYATLEAINVETGERTTIESSKCQVNQATTGWVSSEVGDK